jgi:hypothetical protein
LHPPIPEVSSAALRTTIERTPLVARHGSAAAPRPEALAASAPPPRLSLLLS